MLFSVIIFILFFCLFRFSILFLYQVFEQIRCHFSRVLTKYQFAVITSSVEQVPTEPVGVDRLCPGAGAGSGVRDGRGIVLFGPKFARENGTAAIEAVGRLHALGETATERFDERKPGYVGAASSPLRFATGL